MPDSHSTRVDRDELLRVASDLDRLGMRHSAARIRAAIEREPDERVAPVQDDSGVFRAIPWGLHELLWRVYADHGHGEQSAERLAERGGFGRGEVGMLAVGMYGREDRRPPRGRTIPLLDLYRASLGSAGQNRPLGDET
jgi:hypothetical protein